MIGPDLSDLGDELKALSLEVLKHPCEDDLLTLCFDSSLSSTCLCPARDPIPIEKRLAATEGQRYKR